MAEFTTSETGMTVVRSSPGDSAPGAGLSSPSTAVQSGGGNPLAGNARSPYAAQTTPTSIAPVRKERPPTAGGVVDPSGAGRAGEEPPALAPLETKYAYGSGTTRDQPISAELQGVLQTAAAASGVTAIRIVSGGQPAIGTSTRRVGSTRHDLGRAADLQLIVGDRTLDFNDPGDRPVFETFIRTAVGAGAQGVGAGTNYMGPRTIHVGYGDAAAWGAGGKSVNAPGWLTTAYKAGLAAPVEIDQNATVVYAPMSDADRPDDPFGVAQSKRAAASGPVISFEVSRAPLTVSLGETILDNRQIVERGWNGPAVQELQQFLSWRGIGVVVDGKFGPQTRNAVKEYQRRSEIQVDGRVGPETLQAILYDIDPDVAVMPGQSAYDIGKATAEKIVSPGAAMRNRYGADALGWQYADIPLPGIRAKSREVDIRLPTERPERGEGIPDPRMRPTRELRTVLRTGFAENAGNETVEQELERLRQKQGYYPERGQERTGFEGSPEAQPSQRPGAQRLEPGERQKIIDELNELRRKQALGMETYRKEMARRDSEAAARLATRQRITGQNAGQRDRLRVPSDVLHIGIGTDAVRGAEAIREMARGIGDAYREEIERQNVAASIAGQSDPAVKQAGEVIEKEALASDPNAANTVTGVYVFGPAGDQFALDSFYRNLERRRELERRQLTRDRAKGRVIETGNSPLAY